MIKLNYWITILLFTLTVSSAFSQWTLLNTGTTMEFEAISRAPDGALYALGQHWYKSIDNGNTWTYMPIEVFGISVGTNNWGMHFKSPTAAIVAGNGDLSNYYTMLETNDGGATWSTLIWENVGGWPRYYTEMQFPTSQVGYAAGTNGALMKTVNSGANWTWINSGTTDHIWGMHFWDTNLGLLVSDTKVTRTTDGGAQWQTVLEEDNLHGLGYLSTGEAFTAGQNTFHKSLDFGQTWTTTAAPFYGASEVYALNADTILVFNGTTYVTYTGGEFWETLPAPTDFVINDILFTTPTTAYACGEDGKIIKTSTGIGLGIPIAQFDHSFDIQCGSTTIDLVTNCDPSYSLTWFLNDQQIGTGTAASHTFYADSLSTFSLVADNGSYSDTLLVNINVDVHESVDLVVQDSLIICPGSVGLLSASGADTYSWSPTTGLSDPNAANPEVNIATPTTYTVVGSSGMCVVEDSTYVAVQANIAPDNWSQILQGGVDTLQQSFAKMAWPDDLHGFVWYANEYLARTTDGGATWKDSLLGYNGSSRGDLIMFDPFNGFLAGDGAVKRTNDGWDTFESLMGNDVHDLFFLNPDTGFAMSRFDVDVYKTVDGGENWLQIYDGGSQYSGRLFAYGVDTIIVISSGSPVNLRYTYDGGFTWNYHPTQITGSPRDLVSNGMGSLFVTTNSGGIFRSDDRGFNWIEVLDIGYPIQSIHFTSVNNGYASGNGFTIYRTVDGGNCWQPVFMPIGPEITDICSSSSNRIHAAGNISDDDGLQVWSTGPVTRNIDFTFQSEQICSGEVPNLANSAVGYDSYQWLLDGVPITTDTIPELGPLPVGSHDLTLIASYGGNSDTLTKPLIVRAPPAPLTIVPLTPYCWSDEHIQLALVGLVPGDEVLLYSLDHSAPWNIQTNPFSWGPNTPVDTAQLVVQVIDQFGCVGEYSDTLRVPFAEEPPAPGPISGPTEVCIDTLSTTSSVFTAATIEDAVSYNFYTIPANVGNMSVVDSTLTMEWNSTWAGDVVLRAEVTDECGTGPPASFNISAYPTNYVVTQPQPLTVYTGEPIELTIENALPTTGGVWYRNGQSTGQPGLTFFVSSAFVLAHEGYYQWRGTMLGGCGPIESDSVFVEVLMSTEVEEAGLADPSLTVWPNPVEHILHFQFAEANKMEWRVLDVLGKETNVVRALDNSEGAWSLDVSNLPAGIFYLSIKYQGGLSTVPFTKIDSW